MRTGIQAPVWIGAAVAAAYLNSFWGVFQFDDYNIIVYNPVVHSLSAWLADLGRGIRPLLKLTYTLNWVSGPGEFGFHLFNLGVHLGNTLLVYLLAHLLIAGYGGRATRNASVTAALAALLFGLHPAQTEAVTYISGRSGSLMTLFYLGGMAAYALGRLQRSRLLLYVVSPLLFCLALATKEVAVTFPFALLLWEVSRRAEVRDWRDIARKQWVHWLVLLVAAIALLLHPLYGPRVIPELDPQAAYRNFLSQIGAVSYLVARLVCIYPLNIDPDLREVSSWSPALMAQAALLAALLAAGVWAMRRRPWWSFGLFWFFLHLLPTNSLVQRLDLANDRHLYLAGFGLFVALGVEMQIALSGRSRVLRAAIAAGFLLFGAATAVRNYDYGSEIRLWEQTARVSPEKPRVFNNLGFAYSDAGCLEQAERAYAHAVRLDPRYDLARNNLEHVLRRKTGAAAGEGEAKCDRTLSASSARTLGDDR